MAPTITKTRLIAIAGGSGSGKTTLAKKLAAKLGDAVILAQDSYYHDQSKKFDGDGGSVNFDHPSALDFDLLAAHLRQLKRGEKIDVPIYDFATHTRQKKPQQVPPCSFVLVDGTLILSQPQLVALFDHSIFIDVPESIRFERRLKRDTIERGRSAEGVKKQFELQVAPMHNQFVQPSKTNALEVVNYGVDFDHWVKQFTLL